MIRKNNHDYLLKVMIKSGGFQAVLGSFTDLCNRCVVQHRMKDAGAELFADALTASALLVSQRQETEEKYTIRYDCDGSVNGFILDSGTDGSLRGLPQNPSCGVSQQWKNDADLEKICGNRGSTVEITRSLRGKVLGTGKLETAFLQPSMALGYFVSVSDGVETEICTATELRSDPEAPLSMAYGILLQALPDCDLLKFEQIRNRLQEQHVQSLLKEGRGDGREKLLALLTYLLPDGSELPAEDQIIQADRIRFFCTCSRDRMLAMAMRMLGREDLFKLLQEKPVTGMRCHFCNTEYQFTADDLKDY